jgi:hypothetical protein
MRVVERLRNRIEPDETQGEHPLNAGAQSLQAFRHHERGRAGLHRTAYERLDALTGNQRHGGQPGQGQTRCGSTLDLGGEQVESAWPLATPCVP